MFLLPAAIGTFLLVNLLCACIALGVGFAAGVWFFGAKMAKPAAKAAGKKPAAKQAEESKRAVERTAMAASRVADLAKNVASDVGDHAAKMKAISADLAGIDRDSDGANEAVFTAMDQMIAANTELQQRLEQAEKQLAAQAVEIKTHESEARTDSLTGLSNRRAFDDELKRRLSEWQRKGTPCTLVLMDIDFFKKFNDTHGHQVGDEVLRQVAKVLARSSRAKWTSPAATAAKNSPRFCRPPTRSTPAKSPSGSGPRSKHRPPSAKAKRSKSPAAWVSRNSWPMTTSRA